MLFRPALFAILLFAVGCAGSDAEAPSTRTPIVETNSPHATPAPTASAPPTPTPTPRPGSVTFAAGGDHGANEVTAASLAALDHSGAEFYLALGDIDYDQTATDEVWCDFVRERLPTLGPQFPIEVVSGNHEHDHGPNGNVLNHAGCMPDRLGSTGTYAAQYYFDYPADLPLLRTIMIAPSLTVGGISYEYAPGNQPYSWLSGAIDSARAEGIPWVVVGMHMNCLSTGQKSCEIGEELLNLLVAKKVDLVLQGHDHNYQRSRQLAHAAGCPSVKADEYNPACIGGEGAGGVYGKGGGTIIVISGTFGMSLYPVKPGDAEAGYFAAIDATANGFTTFRVTGERLEAAFMASDGDFSDRFSISDP
jgi:hypothetical protein